MEQFRVQVLVHPRDARGPVQQIDALVDTGAAYSVLSRALVESLGYAAARTQRVVLADGRIVKDMQGATVGDVIAEMDEISA